MDESIRKQLVPGAKVKVVQQIAARNYSWSSETAGTVVEFLQQQTGSWYAHSKDDKLWLDRLTLKKPDGEITTLNLDSFSVVKLDRGAETARRKP
jgi:transposase